MKIIVTKQGRRSEKFREGRTSPPPPSATPLLRSMLVHTVRYVEGYEACVDVYGQIPQRKTDSRYNFEVEHLEYLQAMPGIAQFLKPFPSTLFARKCVEGERGNKY